MAARNDNSLKVACSITVFAQLLDSGGMARVGGRHRSLIVVTSGVLSKTDMR